MDNKITHGSAVENLGLVAKLQPLELKHLENTNEKYNNVNADRWYSRKRGKYTTCERDIRESTPLVSVTYEKVHHL